jgi:hypothetical protein
MTPNLEERITALEEKVSELSLTHLGNGKTTQDDWRSTIGMFAGDAVMKEIIDEGRNLREADRHSSRE